MNLGSTFHALDVKGRSGGMAMGINGRTMKFFNVWG